MVKRASKVVDVEDKQIIEEDVKNYIEVIEKPLQSVEVENRRVVRLFRMQRLVMTMLRANLI